MCVKVSVYIATSLDGFIAREDGGLDWLPGADPEKQDESKAEDYGYREFMDSVDVLVMGRKTFEQVLCFGEWPYQNKRVIVLSSGNVPVPDELASPIEVRSCSPCDLVEQLDADGANHVYVDGGNTIQRFLSDGLIQQIITRIPVLIGTGIPLLGRLKTTSCSSTLRQGNFPAALFKVVTKWM